MKSLHVTRTPQMHRNIQSSTSRQGAFEFNQPDYNELYLTESKEVSEFRGQSDLDLAWSNSCSKLAQYLTKTGASVDAYIKWGSISANEVKSDVSSFLLKRSSDAPASITEQEKRSRRATVGDLVADIPMVKEMLSPSISSNLSLEGNDIYFSVGGTMESVRGILSLAAESGKSDMQGSNKLNQNLPECREFDTNHRLWNISEATESQHIDDDSSAGEIQLYESLSLNMCSSIRSVASTESNPRASSLLLTTHTAPQVTVLFIDIKGFTAQCAATPAAQVGEWVARFYERVDLVAGQHGVSKVEVRGDCCICVAGLEGGVPSRALAAAADRRADQATRTLAFAAALHANLASLPAGAGAAPTTTRMGAATGEAAFLLGDGAAGREAAAAFASVQGDAANLAARMEALGAPGTVRVHKSTSDRWAAEAGRRAPPQTACVECKGRGLQRAAVFDCESRAFRPEAGGDGRAGPAGPAGAPFQARLRKSASGPV